LSSWLRDYLYLPLGGQRRGYARFVIAISVTFLISGLWHGAAVNFLLWGAIHAVLFLAADAAHRVPWPGEGTLRNAPGLRHVYSVVQVWVCFSAVSFAWLFFRVEDLGHIRNILSRLSTWIGMGAPLEIAPLFYQIDALVFFLLLVFAFILDSTRLIVRVLESVPVTTLQISRELAVINTMIIAVVLFGDLGSRQFIYFRF
jgi:D-alanyl-lipoteichoic acid acyltransferase DltB (MBOAT superfamily)